MSNSIELYHYNRIVFRHGLVAELITGGLGYCCEWFFWSAFVDVESAVIANRLGVSARAVRRHRQWFTEGLLRCTCAERCMREKLECLS